MSWEQELNRAKAAFASGRPGDAVAILRPLADSHPSRAVLLGLAQALEAVGDRIAALDAREGAIRLPDRQPGDLYHLAKAQDLALRHGKALETYKELLTIAPQIPEVAVEAARLARSSGDFGGAAALLTPALEKYPDHPRLLAEQVLAGLVDDNTRQRAERLASDQSTEQGGRQALSFALADYHDRGKDPEKAWYWSTLANSLYVASGRTLAEERAAIENAFSVFSEIKPNPPGEAPQLLYLTGPPRSGGSLLQRVLSSPENHKSVGERGAHLPFLFEVTGQGASHWHRNQRSVQESDLAGIKRLAPEAHVVIDKTPHNAHVAGLIARLHPGAVFIDQRRRLKDVLVSIYLNGFSPTFGYSREARTIADYLVLHRRTMERWAAEGVNLREHDHEEFVRSPKEQSSKLFQELGWSWSEDFLEADQGPQHIKTFSARSAREDVSAGYSGRWERYQDFVPSLPDAFLELARVCDPSA